MKTLEDERYVVRKAYKCIVSEIWRDFCISIYYCVYVVSLHTESTDSVICISLIPTGLYRSASMHAVCGLLSIIIVGSIPHSSMAMHSILHMHHRVGRLCM